MGSQTQWRGQSDTTLGRFGWGVLLAAVLHLPFTPLAALFGLLALLSTSQPPPEPLPPLTGIPVDLLEGEEAEVPPLPTPPPPTSEPAVAVEPPPEKPERVASEPKLRDAGVPDAEARDASDDAGDAGDAGTEQGDAGAVDGGITDPVAASGAERIADVNANVQIKIFSEKIRAHPLARRVGPLIASVPQWSDFLGPAALDPITDVDRIMIWGPQLRDSSEVGALVKVNVPEERVRAAIDGIVRSDPETGAWLDAGVPAATARVDRASRVFILPPRKDLVIVVPPSAQENTMKAAKTVRFNPGRGPEVLTARLKTPWRAFRGTGIPFDIPRSISDARFKVTLDEHGGAILEMIAEDESPEKAAENAEYLQRTLSAASELNLGILGAILGTGRHKIVEKIIVTADGKRINGYALFTQRQLAEIIDFAPLLIGARRPRARPARDAGVPNADASSQPSPVPSL
ncbi:MAG TPA: hypothetical protein VFZ53_32450 [Polyangiaceae bacterium]